MSAGPRGFGQFMFAGGWPGAPNGASLTHCAISSNGTQKVG